MIVPGGSNLAGGSHLLSPGVWLSRDVAVIVREIFTAIANREANGWPRGRIVRHPFTFRAKARINKHTFTLPRVPFCSMRRIMDRKCGDLEQKSRYETLTQLEQVK